MVVGFEFMIRILFGVMLTIGILNLIKYIRLSKEKEKKEK